jgi:hypothetical protein
MWSYKGTILNDGFEVGTGLSFFNERQVKKIYIPISSVSMYVTLFGHPFINHF